jgi:hypothetical protein
MASFDFSMEIVADYTLTYPKRRDILLHFGDPYTYRGGRGQHVEKMKPVVFGLAQRGYICQLAKLSGDTGTPALLRVLVQTGFTEEDLRPVDPERLVTVLKEMFPSYTIYAKTVQSPLNRSLTMDAAGKAVRHEVTYIDQVVVCVEI